jgi:hypothetical protein
LTIAYYDSRQAIQGQHRVSVDLRAYGTVEKYAQESLEDGKAFSEARDRYEKSLHHTWKATRSVIGGIQVIDRPRDDPSRHDRPRAAQPKDDRRKDDRRKDDRRKDDRRKDDRRKDDRRKDDRRKDDRQRTR